MWGGVLSGLAGLKFSGSPNKNGSIIETTISVLSISRAVMISFVEKKGVKGLLSKFGFTPLGKFDPFWCKDAKWIKIIPASKKGIKKWSAKNRLKVAIPIENPPHNHWTIISPIHGTAEIRLVITVAPQKDICPQGRTYPRNAVAIRINRIVTPLIHVLLFLKDAWFKLRLIWIKIKIKNLLAPFICINRKVYPYSTSRVMWNILENALLTSEL